MVLTGCGERRDKTPPKVVKPKLELTVVGDRAQHGYDSLIEVRAQRTPSVGTLSWRQVKGPKLRELKVSEEGTVLIARMPSRVAAGLHQVSKNGVVAISPTTQGKVTLQATWRGAPGNGPVQERIDVMAAARSRGLTSLPMNHRSYLAGGWKILQRPEGSQAELHSHGDLQSLSPDRSCSWTLEGQAGRMLRLRSHDYQTTPLDCGRSGCHREIAESVSHSQMTSVFHRGLGRLLGRDYDPSCTMACHTTGEPGIDDGGFEHMMRSLGVPTLRPHPDTWYNLPRELRRVGGVGCLACHGPGAIGERSERADILRTDVCAVCHDGPPRYGHVEAWRSSTMAQADRDPRTRANPECASCHSTHGFLVSQGLRSADRPHPEESQGLSCVTCHAPHGTGPPAADGFHSAPVLRDVRLAEAWDGVVLPKADKLCVSCHGDTKQMRATSAAVWYGLGAVDPISGDSVEKIGVHRRVENGCRSCHEGRGRVRGEGHSFKASARSCSGCHEGRSVNPKLMETAGVLWSRLASGGWVPESEPGQSPHRPPVPKKLAPGERGAVISRVARNLQLLMADAAAAVHNPQFAEWVVSSSEFALSKHLPTPPTGGVTP